MDDTIHFLATDGTTIFRRMDDDGGHPSSDECHVTGRVFDELVKLRGELDEARNVIRRLVDAPAVAPPSTTPATAPRAPPPPTLSRMRRLGNAIDTWITTHASWCNDGAGYTPTSIDRIVPEPANGGKGSVIVRPATDADPHKKRKAYATVVTTTFPYAIKRDIKGVDAYVVSLAGFDLNFAIDTKAEIGQRGDGWITALANTVEDFNEDHLLFSLFLVDASDNEIVKGGPFYSCNPHDTNRYVHLHTEAGLVERVDANLKDGRVRFQNIKMENEARDGYLFRFVCTPHHEALRWAKGLTARTPPFVVVDNVRPTAGATKVTAVVA